MPASDARPLYAFTEAEKAHFREIQAELHAAEEKHRTAYMSAFALIHKQQRLEGIYGIAEDGSGLVPVVGPEQHASTHHPNDGNPQPSA